MGQVAETIEAKLKAAFEPITLEIIDESHLHRGHAGAPEGGESHFRAKIVSELFEGLSRLDRQRRVNETLREELAGPVHAFSAQTLTPGEA
ncbi:BolA family protein [Parvularcula maris]|uniref:BolA family transcriptional regulator n=1 Tax=Parvularcula maris TaxID=2965077 RepID=A0A9X2L8S8_9PROT|nr:BolA family protein [Parvularcula maris]MCQ8184297.1 BolA family transcriptional regulator [Parvularcula maris]